MIALIILAGTALLVIIYMNVSTLQEVEARTANLEKEVAAAHFKSQAATDAASDIFNTEVDDEVAQSTDGKPKEPVYVVSVADLKMVRPAALKPRSRVIYKPRSSRRAPANGETSSNN